MIKLKENKKIDLEQAIYEAKVEEALAKWEAASPSETKQTKKVPPQPKKGCMLHETE